MNLKSNESDKTKITLNKVASPYPEGRFAYSPSGLVSITFACATRSARGTGEWRAHASASRIARNVLPARSAREQYAAGNNSACQQSRASRAPCGWQNCA